MKNLVLYRSEVYTAPCLYRSRSQETGWGGATYLGGVFKERFRKRIGVDEGEKNLKGILEHIGEGCI